MPENKSCFNCKNCNICKHYRYIFDKFEVYQFMNDYQSFINLVGNGIGERCKYYILENREEFK